MLPTVLFAINFGIKMRLEILKMLASNRRTKLFNFFVCGSIHIRDFRKQHIDEMETGSNESSEPEHDMKFV